MSTHLAYQSLHFRVFSRFPHAQQSVHLFQQDVVPVWATARPSQRPALRSQWSCLVAPSFADARRDAFRLLLGPHALHSYLGKSSLPDKSSNFIWFFSSPPTSSSSPPCGGRCPSTWSGISTASKTLRVDHVLGCVDFSANFFFWITQCGSKFFSVKEK